ncbi:NAD(P)/FAD-dependent oxidoreductase [Pleurocapsa sp. PCC 7319]|uniref:NAD(P)/FAD-dependent oxidoreductase n=1 Tax=Pleurocapsa sp. PCC 7319 TaxID=118161 RepID=UPI00034CEBD0|nr:FAD-dependent oxidoreductase [Pleurocapsa sp. PCC 7319]
MLRNEQKQELKQLKDSSACIIIGGGISGLIIATLLQRRGMKVTVLDKGRGIGGRLATRRINYSEDIEGVFDYGAQYFSVKQPEFQVWVDDWLKQGVIREWCRGFGKVDGKSRYCGVKGTRSIAKYLAQDLEVHTSTRVVKLNYETQWLIETEENQQFRGDILVMTPPVPQSLDLLDNSQIDLATSIRTSLEQISYHRCIAVLALLEKPSSIPTPGGLALEDESLVWLASNSQKGISPNGYAITLHAYPHFSDTYWNYSDTEIAQKLLGAASSWINSPVIKYQVHRWRYSLPKTFYSKPYLALPELPLVMAGDAFVSPKIEGAVLSGIAAARYILQESI